MANIPEFVGNHPVLVAAFFGILGLIIYNEVRRGNRAYAEVGVFEATQLSNQQDALFLDVREEHEYRQGHLNEAKHIPLGRLESRLSELESVKDKPIIAYCRSGQRSQQACELLARNGFEALYNLKGGLLAWQGEGMPVSKSKNRGK